MPILVSTLVVTGGRSAALRPGHELKQGYVPGTHVGDVIICIYRDVEVAKEALAILQDAIDKCHNMKNPAPLV